MTLTETTSSSHRRGHAARTRYQWSATCLALSLAASLAISAPAMAQTAPSANTSDTQQPEPPGASPPGAPTGEEDWYGWQILLLEIPATLLVGLGYVTVSPAVHYAHGQPDVARKAVVIRLGLPLAVAGSHWWITEREDRVDGATTIGLLLASLVGAVAIDVAALAYEPAPLSPAELAALGARPPLHKLVNFDLSLGLAMPTGFIGVEASLAPLQEVSASAGVGIGFSGPQVSFMARLHLPTRERSRLQSGREFTLGLGGSQGDFGNEELNLDRINQTWWVNAEAAILTTDAEGNRTRLFGGVGKLLYADAKLDIWPYVGFSTGFSL